MKKKERIAQLEKEIEELKNRILLLEMYKTIGIGDNPSPYLPKPYLPDDYKYPYTTPTTPTIPYPFPIITWQYVPDTKTSIL